MKIVHSFFTMETGGAQILAVDLLNEMCKKHSVSLVIINNKFNAELLGRIDKRVKIYFIDRKEGSKNPLPLLRFNWLLRKIKPDVVHCHESKMAKIIWGKVVKRLYTVHDVGINPEYLKDYDRCIAISEAVFNDIRSKSSVDIKTIHNGVPLSSFTKRKSYDLNDSNFKMVQVSRLVHEKKGQDIVLHAIAGIQQKYPLIKISLDLIGEGPSLQYLKSLVIQLNLTDKVNFLGEKKRPWIAENLQNYELLVQPSRYEGFGLTIVEGMAAGIPVLASHIDGPAEIITNTNGGFLFKNEDVENCGKKILEVYSLYQSQEMQSFIDAIGSKLNKYSIATCADEYINEYNEL